MWQLRSCSPGCFGSRAALPLPLPLVVLAFGRLDSPATATHADAPPASAFLFAPPSSPDPPAPFSLPLAPFAFCPLPLAPCLLLLAPVTLGSRAAAKGRPFPSDVRSRPIAAALTAGRACPSISSSKIIPDPHLLPTHHFRPSASQCVIVRHGASQNATHNRARTTQRNKRWRRLIPTPTQMDPVWLLRDRQQAVATPPEAGARLEVNRVREGYDFA